MLKILFCNGNLKKVSFKRLGRIYIGSHAMVNLGLFKIASISFKVEIGEAIFTDILLHCKTVEDSLVNVRQLKHESIPLDGTNMLSKGGRWYRA